MRVFTVKKRHYSLLLQYNRIKAEILQVKIDNLSRNCSTKFVLNVLEDCFFNNIEKMVAYF